ncbi:PREDICTED: SCAN domain-containing protein 1-like [Chrysochloris asiatica]|uniref:SCAN domain-containing protein 1-like n=1 Tax=Chrysochloris asiatica TaxID=185453 RepID=A0A9B0TJE0_CHRAS|nr:PREDICTED: SCAN domain-containing protein 1-like [Chrysochloris asiatica]
METVKYTETQGNRDDAQIKSPDEAMPVEPKVIPAPLVQASLGPAGPSPKSLDEDSVEDIPRRIPPNPAAYQQRFRQFRYESAPGPRAVLQRLQELAELWLRPDINTKEQIMEILVLEQLQAILPEELKGQVRRFRRGVRITG